MHKKNHTDLCRSIEDRVSAQMLRPESKQWKCSAGHITGAPLSARADSSPFSQDALRTSNLSQRGTMLNKDSYFNSKTQIQTARSDSLQCNNDDTSLKCISFKTDLEWTFRCILNRPCMEKKIWSRVRNTLNSWHFSFSFLAPVLEGKFLPLCFALINVTFHWTCDHVPPLLCWVWVAMAVFQRVTPT